LLELAMCTHRGSPREQQDAALVGNRVIQSVHALVNTIDDGYNLLLAIADGVATSPSAAMASRRYLSALAGVVKGSKHSENLLTARQIREAHQVFCDELTHKRLSCGASTTLVAAHVIQDRVAVLNVGDSRAYLRSASGDVTQISRDHTELNRLRETGLADAGVQYASIYDALSDCLIADPEETGFGIHGNFLRLGVGDTLILCSDGVHDGLGSAWPALIAEDQVPESLVRKTRDRLLAAGAPDNFTVIAASRASA